MEETTESLPQVKTATTNDQHEQPKICDKNNSLIQM